MDNRGRIFVSNNDNQQEAESGVGGQPQPLVDEGPPTSERDLPDAQQHLSEMAPQEPLVPTGPSLPDVQQSIERLTGLVADIQQQIEALQRGFESKIKYDASKEKVIDSLHRELQVYREDMHFKILRPILLDLIAMYDDLDSLIKHAQTQEASTESEMRLRRNLATFVSTIEEILSHYGVEAYSVEGENMVPQRQRSIKVVETDIAERDRLVAERIRKGFAYEGKILRPEFVATFKYSPPLLTEGSERSP